MNGALNTLLYMSLRAIFFHSEEIFIRYLKRFLSSRQDKQLIIHQKYAQYMQYVFFY